MFDFPKLKEELEQLKCPVHGQTAIVNFTDGKLNLENVCCEEHRLSLTSKVPEIEDRLDLADILEDVF